MKSSIFLPEIDWGRARIRAPRENAPLTAIGGRFVKIRLAWN